MYVLLTFALKQTEFYQRKIYRFNLNYIILIFLFFLYCSILAIRNLSVRKSISKMQKNIQCTA